MAGTGQKRKMPALACGGCGGAIRKGSRSKTARCEAGHTSHLHRRCLKASSRCAACDRPIAALVDASGRESAARINALRTKARNEALASALWSELERGKQSAEVPRYIKWAHLETIKRRMRRQNCRGTKWQDAPDRIDPAKLEAFLAAIKRV